MADKDKEKEKKAPKAKSVKYTYSCTVGYLGDAINDHLKEGKGKKLIEVFIDPEHPKKVYFLWES